MSPIPRDRPVRVVGDVHGDIAGFSAAASGDHFIVQLGDLVDHGPDSAAVLRLMLELIAEGRGLFILGNHDFKLARALAGRPVTAGPALRRTLEMLDADLRLRAAAVLAEAPAWLLHGDALFVHGGFHTAMLDQPPPRGELGRPEGPFSRALYGEPTGRRQADGYPERSLAWVDRIPPGLTVYCGHDRRSTDGRPWVNPGRAGGRAIFLDTGAGKGGHLSWIDLKPSGNEGRLVRAG
jgi:protein phosphatase